MIASAVIFRPRCGGGTDRAGAREHLRAQHDMLNELGVDGFAQRARRELGSIGDTVQGW